MQTVKDVASRVLWFAIKANNAWSSTTSAVITLPIDTSGVSLTKCFVSSTATEFLDVKSAADSIAGTVVNTTPNTYALTSGTITLTATNK